MLFPRLPFQTRPDGKLPRLGISAAGLRKGRWAGSPVAEEAEEAQLTSSQGSGFWLALRGLQSKAEAGSKGGARRGCISGCQSGCLERSRRSSSSRPCLWCPAPWGRRERKGEWEGERVVSGELASLAGGLETTEHLSQPAPGQPGTQGAEWPEKYPGRVRESPGTETIDPLPAMLLLRAARSLATSSTSPNPHPLCHHHTCPRGPNRCSVHPPPHSQGLLPRFSTCPLLWSSRGQPSGMEVFGSHSLAFCLSFPHYNSELRKKKKKEGTGYLPT